jgi:hypothetical protein
MAKISVEHSRLAPSVSVALVKDEDSGEKLWRYRFVFSGKSGTYIKHDFKDYAYEEFSSLDQFKRKIEYQRESEKTSL